MATPKLLIRLDSARITLSLRSGLVMKKKTPKADSEYAPRNSQESTSGLLQIVSRHSHVHVGASEKQQIDKKTISARSQQAPPCKNKKILTQNLPAMDLDQQNSLCQSCSKSAASKLADKKLKQTNKSSQILAPCTITLNKEPCVLEHVRERHRLTSTQPRPRCHPYRVPC